MACNPVTFLSSLIEHLSLSTMHMHIAHWIAVHSNYFIQIGIWQFLFLLFLSLKLKLNAMHIAHFHWNLNFEYYNNFFVEMKMAFQIKYYIFSIKRMQFKLLFEHKTQQFRTNDESNEIMLFKIIIISRYKFDWIDRDKFCWLNFFPIKSMPIRRHSYVFTPSFKELNYLRGWFRTERK